MSTSSRSQTSRSSASSAVPSTSFSGSHGVKSPTSTLETPNDTQAAANAPGLKSGATTGPDGNASDKFRRRHRPRNSGGFLLNAKSHTSTQHREQDSSEGKVGGKGHGKSKERELTTVDARAELDVARWKSVVGKSPLGNEISHNEQGSDSPSAASSSTEGYRDGSTKTARTAERGSEVSAFSSDPAQIVSLALNLSENRRRHFSTGRVTSLEPNSGRRMVSTPHVGTMTPGTPAVGSLRHHLNQQRRGSRTISPKPERNPSTTKRTAYATAPYANGLGLQNQLLPEVDLGTLVDPTFSPSDATLLRAEKAKVALELAYEHRRLLQHLPALPSCAECRPPTAKAALARGPGQMQPLGRLYNPLQYIRNRKVRVRERQTLDSEADGWKDIESVRAWVGLVSTERQARVAKVDDEYPLPDFSGRKEEQDDTPTSPGAQASASALRNSQGKKVSRPRNDWVTSPWDFLGDQYWLNQGTNKFLIEDCHRHKIYGMSGGRPETAKTYSRRSHSITRANNTPERIMTTRSLGEEVSPQDRGRPSHQRQTSFQSIREYSTSRERKSKWPRKFKRSRSSSSSEDSDDDTKMRRKGQDPRDYQYRRMLDRQLEAFLERQQSSWKWGDITDLDDGDTTDPKSADVSAFSSRHPSFGGPDDRALAAIKRPRHIYSLSKDAPDARISETPGSPSAEDIANQNNNLLKPTKNVPSIAINDPTRERSISPAAERPRPDRSILSEMGKEREQIQDIDFAAMDTNKTSKKLRQSRDRFGNNHKSRNGEHRDKVRVETPTKLKSRRFDERSTKETRDRKESDFKFRGLLKGARLADIVSSPVNRVGEYIWRKDATDQEDDDNSVNSVDFSDAEAHAGNSRPGLARTDTDLSKESTSEEPRYHMDNLPVFKSPFGQNQTGDPAETQDHISRQQSVLRQQRSGRFERLAPPSLDMRSISRPTSPNPEAAEGTDFTSDDSRRPSAGGDRRFAVVEGSPDRRGLRHPVTGNQSDTRKRWFQDEAGFMDLDLQPSTEGKVSARDIDRTTALVTSTQVKVNRILWQAASVRDPPHPVLQELQRTSTTPIGPVPRAQEAVLIGGLLVKRIDDNNTAMREAADKFNNETVAGLHQQLRSLDEYITNKLTGMVRKAADDADDIGSKLAAECTMEVKRQNENIDLVLRRRRRRLRWIRRGGYALLEWTLLGLMWMVWLFVVVFKIGRGTIRCIVAVLKWLLWIT